MKWVVTYKKSGEREYTVDGKAVTQEDFDRLTGTKKDFLKEPPILVNGDWAEPIHSDALAYHPNQIAEATEHFRKNGIPTEIDRAGRPILRSREHRRQVLKLEGVVDHKSFTGY